MTGDKNKQTLDQRRFTFFGETGETAAADSVGTQSQEAVVRSQHKSVSAPGSTSVLTTNAESAFPLATATVGDRLWIFGHQGKGGMSKLLGMGLVPGTAVEIVSSTGTGSVIVAFGDNRIGLGAGMAEKVLVTKTKMEAKPMTQKDEMHLRDIPVGGKGRVVGYEKAARAYKGKLLAMGLTPGTEFAVIRHAPMGDPVEVQVRGFHLSLRKQEADALCVEGYQGQAGQTDQPRGAERLRGLSALLHWLSRLKLIAPLRKKQEETND